MNILERPALLYNVKIYVQPLIRIVVPWHRGHDMSLHRFHFSPFLSPVERQLGRISIELRYQVKVDIIARKATLMLRIKRNYTCFGINYDALCHKTSRVDT